MTTRRGDAARVAVELERGQQRDRAAERVADERHVLQVALAQEGGDEGGLVGGGVGLVARLVGAAEAAQVERDDAVGLRQGGHDVAPGEGRGAEPVDEHQRRAGAGLLDVQRRSAAGPAPRPRRDSSAAWAAPKPRRRRSARDPRIAVRMRVAMRVESTGFALLRRPEKRPRASAIPRPGNRRGKWQIYHKPLLHARLHGPSTCRAAPTLHPVNRAGCSLADGCQRRHPTTIG